MSLTRILARILIPIAALLLNGVAQAQLTIEISGTGENRIPVTIAPFAGEGLLNQSVSEVVQRDLERTGLFRLIPTGSLLAVENVAPDYPAWRSLGSEALLVGSISALADGQLEVRYRLHDVSGQREYFVLKVNVRNNQARALGHHIANKVYEQLTGQRGYFSTRIAYVEKRGSRYQLMVADYDGENAVPALILNEPIISLSWSPDGKRLAYVSFEKRKPVVYVSTLATGARTVLANYKGSNSAPAWSPDGQQLALTLTRDGHSQIYLVNANGSGLRRLTNSSGIDTEPFFSPDGSMLYFTSDRGGSPQIYRQPLAGGEAQRVSFNGAYNVTPRISPDGKTLVYVSRNDGLFQISKMDLATQESLVLTNSAQDESPSFAPDSRTILYATEMGGRGVLSVVSIDGRTRYRLNDRNSDLREPAWSPLEK
ncbi:MAG: Tol-Pal system beta propeller repeat protein TolB [Candidatus Dactylopiibacterium carminicum]|uniref:Tol-Pal system protein TolB n=1 Tax=Candidatus Dactylopiibacterium carminicum TaxID=857335 RepID=A0A272EQP7_9RHOO|nr:Tol-Pal system beta propeller repeat protein TolB [Candidatus Dactylopiibacterium carminicum]KAF7598646.1 Tol-Pal system beta propeller repeat protein TolB [Candidatus Dactylopiibacterium carminicum]PAS92412.1 MAG: Tol-Pal system beta propeller repeat protein TolB [Candidatus Dactylopiibacterium carminicum]PAS98413.1 MAG: Tol-Pal system beta propeller repeat protein TolB [Candidatus Dactylopiibacterium carminicum]